jgi:hypothetical protein
VRWGLLQLPFDLDLPIYLYVTGYTLFRAVSVLRDTASKRAIPVNIEHLEVPASGLTAEQSQYLAGWDKKLEALNYRPVCTYRAVLFGHNLQRAYLAPGDTARCTVMVIELETSGEIKAVHHSCTVRFVTDYADGRRLAIINSKARSFLDPCPNHISQKCPNVNDVAELKRRHDRRGAALGQALWPPADATSIVALDEQKRKLFDQCQLDRGLRKLTPAGDAFVLTDKAHWRAVRNHYNPFAQRFSIWRLALAIVIGAAVPLLSLLKLAPAAANLVALPGAAEATNTAAYLVAGALIGYLLDCNLIWTFLISYITAHAVLGWSFGPWPYSMLASVASFFARQAKHRRQLILMEA